MPKGVFRRLHLHTDQLHANKPIIQYVFLRLPFLVLKDIEVYSFPLIFLEIKRKQTLQSPHWPGQSPYPLSEWRVLIEHDSQNLNPEAKEIIFGAPQFSWNTVKKKVELAEVSIFTEQT